MVRNFEAFMSRISVHNYIRAGTPWPVLDRAIGLLGALHATFAWSTRAILPREFGIHWWFRWSMLCMWANHKTMRSSSLCGRFKRETCKQSKSHGFLMMTSLIREMTRIAITTFWHTDFVHILVETRVGGNPEWIIKPRLRWRDSWSDLLYAKTLLTAGDFLTLPLIVHLRRGRPENDSPSGPLDDDQILLFTGDSDVFIGGVTNWSNSC